MLACYNSDILAVSLLFPLGPSLSVSDYPYSVTTARRRSQYVVAGKPPLRVARLLELHSVFPSQDESLGSKVVCSGVVKRWACLPC